MKLLNLIAAAALLALTSCSGDATNTGPAETQKFLDHYSKTYQDLDYEESLAGWDLNTHIVEGDTTAAARASAAGEATAKFIGSTEVINRVRELLANPEGLTPLQIRQLEVVLFRAGDNPQTVADLVTEKIKLDNELIGILFGFDFKIDGKSVTANEIDRILREERDLDKRLAAWTASKEVGRLLKPGLARIRDLRNSTVQELGYDDFFSYQVSEYGMTSDEMMTLMRQITREAYPLYRELHTWARYELADRYGAAAVPDLIPAHWLPDRWAQDWSPLVTVEGADLDGALKDYTAEQVVKDSEAFYVSLGFDPLPQNFYDRSSLYPLPPGTEYKKNSHASAWNMNYDDDIRSLMSVENNARWYETSHHELGHVYYYIQYNRPEVPLLLRRGANRGFHEAIGSLLGFAAMQGPFLKEVGLLPESVQADRTQQLLYEALNYVVFLPFGAGVMSEFEHDLYANQLPADQFNARWWDLAQEYQGIAPPLPRGEEYADAATKTHIIDDAAQYYDYAISYLLLFQFHDHIARNILNEDPHQTSYYGHTEVGDFLGELMAPGNTVDWRELLRETTGEDLNAGPLLRYFEPLMEYLKEANRGKTYTLPLGSQP
ncbi:MAG TPA: M2 family metallopeptidase [Rhodothermia bacterium]